MVWLLEQRKVAPYCIEFTVDATANKTAIAVPFTCKDPTPRSYITGARWMYTILMLQIWCHRSGFQLQKNRFWQATMQQHEKSPFHACRTASDCQVGGNIK